MADFTVLEARWSLDREGDWIAFRVPSSNRRVAQKLCDDIKEPWEASVAKERKKRSVNANAYAWSLIGRIADAIRSSKEEVHLEMLRRYGQSETVSVRDGIDVSSLFQYYDEIGTGTVKCKKFIHYRVYRGSHTYDTKEMSVYIDGIVSEAKELDIETLTPDELQKIKVAIPFRLQ